LAEFKVELHPDQLTVFKDPRRFKIVVAGRRWGKSRLALYELFIEALKASEADVYYIAPTFDQGKRIMWSLMKKIGKDLITWSSENTATCQLVNERKIFICGSDRPDTIRGVPMALCVLDEYASMKPFIWQEIVRPALMDVKGKALFIGTPAGKNHFYDLWMEHQDDKDWGLYQFKSKDNPFLDVGELEAASSSLSTQVARQELEASFESFSSGLFKEEWIKYDTEPEEGDWVVVADLAGFEESSKERGQSTGKLDESAIWAVKVHSGGWFLGDLEHGRWNIRETSVRLLRLAQERHAQCIGIERGSLMNAVRPFLEEQMRKTGYFPRVEMCTHGNKKKTDRIMWSLQGRFERGAITLRRATWNRVFIEQLLDFPNPQAHDDLVDALSYTEQIAVIPYHQNGQQEFEDYEFEPQDIVAGY
jgi:predicted phage terminase large subunit-like protein